jgi:calcineurin-like phosphoesterase
VDNRTQGKEDNVVATQGTTQGTDDNVVATAAAVLTKGGEVGCWDGIIGCGYRGDIYGLICCC